MGRLSSSRRSVSAILISLVTALWLFNPFSRQYKSLFSLNCQEVSDHGNIQTNQAEGLPISSAFATLKAEFDLLKQSVEHLKVQVPQTLDQLPESTTRESRRIECREEVSRNIDPLHV
jgi:hypothetical protein